MKFLVLAACVAVSSAQGFFGLQAHPNGAVTPVDEPAVAAARADHLATKFGGLGYAGYAPGYGYAGLGYAAGYSGYAGYPYATGYNGYAGYPYAAGYSGYTGYPYAAGYAGYTGYPYAAGYGYAGPLNLNNQLIAHPNGAVVPLDEPAVAAARAAHLETQAAEYAASAPIVAAAPAIAAAPVVAAAPAIAAAPVVAAAPAISAAPVVGYAGYAGPLNLNTQLVAHPNGAVVPVDEPAVAAARADHLATKGVYGGVYAAAGPVAYAAGYAPYAGLVAHPNGAVVPVDEPAVAAARADHLAAHGY